MKLKLILPVFLVVLLLGCMLGTTCFDYRKNGWFEWATLAILFACLVFKAHSSSIHVDDFRDVIKVRATKQMLKCSSPYL